MRVNEVIVGVLGTLIVAALFLSAAFGSMGLLITVAKWLITLISGV